MEVKRVDPKEAERLVREEGYLYLDVRSEPEWQNGHAPGSRNVPIAFLVPGQGMVPNPDFVPVCTKLFAKDTKLVVGCKSGGRSQRAVHALQHAGFTGAVDLRGGMDGEMDPSSGRMTPGWAAQGLPTTRECPSEHTYTSLSKGQ